MGIMALGMKAFQATGQLTKASESSRIPVIIMPKNQKSERVWGSQGACDYLGTGISIVGLLLTMCAILAVALRLLRLPYLCGYQK